MKKFLLACVLFACSSAVAVAQVTSNPTPGSVWTYFGPTLGGGWGPTIVGQTVPDNTTLALQQYSPGGILLRQDYAVGNGAPPLTFLAQLGTCASHSMVNDGGSCVDGPTGDSWKAVYSAGPVDIRQWGATPAADLIPKIAAAYAANTGHCTWVPSGVWQLQSGTTFSAGPPCIEGVGAKEYNNTGATCPTSVTGETWFHEAAAMVGTTPFTLSGSGTAGNQGFRGIGFCQDHPAPGGGWAPTAYAPIFQLSATGEIDFDRLYFYAVYDAIQLSGVSASGRQHFSNLRGQVFHHLLNADNVRDVLHFSGEVHLWTYWSNDANVVAWQHANGEPLLLGRVDGAVFEDFFALGYHYCLHSLPTANGPITAVTFNTFYCDNSFRGIYAEKGPGNGNSTVQIANAVFGGGSLAGSWGIEVAGAGTLNAVVQIGTMHVIAMGGGAAEITATGGGLNWFKFGNILYTNINQDNNNSPLLSIPAGSIGSVASAPAGDGNNNSAPITDSAALGVYDIPVPLVWTPTIGASSSSGTPAYNGASTVGWVFRSGSLVIVHFNIQLTDWTGSPSGTTQINLPVLASAVLSQPGTCQIDNMSGITPDAGYFSVVGRVLTNTSIAELFETTATATPIMQTLTADKIGTTAIIAGLCTYQGKLY